MKKQERLLRTFSVVCGCALLILALDRCSPIGASSNKTLIHTNIGDHDLSGPARIQETSPHDAFESTGLSYKARLVDTANFMALATPVRQGKILFDLPSEDPEEDADESAFSVLTLNEVQLGDLREHHRTLVQLPETPPAEISIYIETSNPAQSTKRAGDMPGYIEVQLKAVTGDIWRLSIDQSQKTSLSETQWSPSNILNVIIRFSRTRPKGREAAALSRYPGDRIFKNLFFSVFAREEILMARDEALERGVG